MKIYLEYVIYSREIIVIKIYSATIKKYFGETI